MVQITPMVRNLLIINILVFAVQNIAGIDLINLLGLRYIFSEYFAPHQLLTHFFVHANFSHIFSNMLGLYVFGAMLEQIWGGRKFLFFYVSCALGAAALYSAVHYYEVSQLQAAASLYLENPNFITFESFVAQNIPDFALANPKFMNEFNNNPNDVEYINASKEFIQEMFYRKSNMPMVGASGAIFGVLMAFAMIFPNLELMLLFPPMPVKAKYLVAFYALYEMYSVWENSPKDNVAHFAHIGGMLFAFIILKAWGEKRRY